jgi:VanZ family protein
MKRFLLYWLPALVWMGMIFVSSAQRQLPQIGGPESPWDPIAHKVAHVAVYAVLAWLYDRLLGRALLPQGQRRAVAVCLAVLYGLSDELHQAWVPGRSGRLVDVGVDAAGAGAAMLLWAWLEPRLPLHRARAAE